jgi:hypothetical protein
VTQIAEAAEVSESAFFRYFPTKEDVVFWDGLDPLVFEAFRELPPESVRGGGDGRGALGDVRRCRGPASGRRLLVDDGLAQLEAGFPT